MAAAGADFEVVHEREQGLGKKRFVVGSEAKDLAYVEYELASDVMDLYHTFTDPDARGKGLAGKVVRAALEFAEESKLKVKPS